MVIDQHPALEKYKHTMSECIKLYYPKISDADLNAVIDYSINKRYTEHPASLKNSYTHKEANSTLLQLTDYILKREPITTAYGTMFKHHSEEPNPLATVVNSFLELRGIHKKEMFKYPKGSEDFAKYNLLQSLDKIDANGIYGTLGQYTSLIYNIYVATSITSQGRALTSSATMFFESFLANNVKFGSLNEVIEFINNVKHERYEWKFNDFDWLDNSYEIQPEDVFGKLILTCGYRWVPNQEEMEIIWTCVNNLDQELLNRVWYKNNLYEFMENSKVFDILNRILHNLEHPLFTAVEIPVNVQDDVKLLSSLLKEYVYYRYMVIDRIDRTNNMIKSVICITDTDSCILSLDAWFRYVSQKISGEEYRLMQDLGSPITFFDYTEEDEELGKPKPWEEPISFLPKKYDYDFNTDEIVELDHINNPTIQTGNDNMRYTIVNIMAYIIDGLINDYMEKFCSNTNSIGMNYQRDCRILMKNEYLFKRVLMTQVKKNYAALIAVQEGNLVPEDQQLAITGIECLTKSTKSDSTKNALKSILLEDIMRADQIDQLKIIKDFAIFEKRLVQSLQSGSKEYYKPATIKSANSYDDPLRIQGVKASIAWNNIRPKELPGIDLETRNGIDIAKVIINGATIEKIKDTYPEIYENMKNTLDMDAFKKLNKKTGKVISNEINAIAIPMDVDVPDWLLEFIDYPTLVNDNIGGFPYESVGIMTKKANKVNYTNIVQI